MDLTASKKSYRHQQLFDSKDENVMGFFLTIISFVPMVCVIYYKESFTVAYFSKYFKCTYKSS